MYQYDSIIHIHTNVLWTSSIPCTAQTNGPNLKYCILDGPAPGLINKAIVFVGAHNIYSNSSPNIGTVLTMVGTENIVFFSIKSMTESRVKEGRKERNNSQPRKKGEERKMGFVSSGIWLASPVFISSFENGMFSKKKSLILSKNNNKMLYLKKKTMKNGITCKVSESGIEKNPRSKSKMDDYNIAMKSMMRNPYEYHHDLGMNYTVITDSLIVGSQPQKPEDIDHLKVVQNVAYILNLQQDKDIEYWGIDLQSIVKRCKELNIRHMRRPARDFDPDSLRSGLPKAVSTLEWAISEGKGRVYVHCTAGLGRAPAVAIAYMFWFCGMNLTTAYDALTSKRPCGPNKSAIRGATYDLAKNDPWKEPFESLPEHAFEGVADWERKLIQERVRGLRGT